MPLAFASGILDTKQQNHESSAFRSPEFQAAHSRALLASGRDTAAHVDVHIEDGLHVGQVLAITT